MEQPPMVLVAVAIVAIVIVQSFLSPASSDQAAQLKGVSSEKSAPAAATASSASKKKKKKTKKKSAEVVPEEKEEVPPPVVEGPKVQEPEIEEEPDITAASKKKKKKKKKAAVAPAPSPTPVVTPKTEEEEPKKAETTTAAPVDDNDEEEDDDDDVSRLLNASQLSKTQKKKKKKKKKADSAPQQDQGDEGSWVVVNKQHKQEESSQAAATTDASTPDATESKHTVTLQIEAEDKPILVGSKGSTIQNITNTSGARLDIDIPILKITGTEPQIAVAMEMVQELLSAHRAKTAFSKTLKGKEINSSEGVKAIIGKGGSTIKEIQAKTGCKLDAEIDAGTVVITGSSEEKVQEAATLCRHAVFGEHQVTMDLQDKSRVMLVLGHGFQKIRQFQDESGGAKLDIAKNSTVLKISGPTEAVNKAKDMVAAWLNHCAGITMNIPQSAPGSFDKVGAIYGKGGATIRTIQDKTGAFINVDDKQGKVQISGVPSAVQGALKMVQQAMEDGCLIEEGEIRDAVSIPKKAGPAVIGRGGSNISQMEKTHNVKLRMSGQTCIIIGQASSVARCKTELVQTVEPFLEEERIQREAERLASEQEAASAGASAWNASIHDDVADGW